MTRFISIAGAAAAVLALGACNEPRPEQTETASAFPGADTVADQDVLVRPGRVRSPGDFAGLGIEGREPATHAHFAAAVADEHAVLHDERRHRHRFADVDVAEFRAPQFLAGRGVHRVRHAGVVEPDERRAGDAAGVTGKLHGGGVRQEFPLTTDGGLYHIAEESAAITNHH